MSSLLPSDDNNTYTFHIIMCVVCSCLGFIIEQHLLRSLHTYFPSLTIIHTRREYYALDLSEEIHSFLQSRLLGTFRSINSSYLYTGRKSG